MKKHNTFVLKFLKKYEKQCPDIVKDWCSIHNQENFNKLRSTNKQEKRRSTCYILFCIQRRPELQNQYPNLPNTQITSMMASEWREHRDAHDEVYLKYKNIDDKQVFFKTHKPELNEKYPHLSNDEINLALDKMYVKLS